MNWLTRLVRRLNGVGTRLADHMDLTMEKTWRSCSGDEIEPYC